MNFQKELRAKVKPELNHIYTEKPLNTQHGLDLGWYCREHALHLYGLAILLGMTAKICTGDFILYFPDRFIHYSVRDYGDHAWCNIDEQGPVDISMTIKYIDKDLEDIKLISVKHPNFCSPFQLKYFVNQGDDLFLSLKNGSSPLIAYNEKDSESYDLIDLLENPFQFLFRPPMGAPTFPEIHGEDVFYSITYHCYRLVTEDIRPLYKYRNPKGTVKGIMKHNPNAKNKILDILRPQT